jgi:hypothetical protein
MTPTKRKLSTMAGHDDDHKAEDSIVSKIDNPIPNTPLSVPCALKQVGVYMQTIVASDEAHTTEPPHLVSVAKDLNTAHADMLAHSGEQIGKNPQWGAARHIPRNGTWDLVDAKDVVHLRYRLEAIRSTDLDTTGNPVDWLRETEWLQNHYADRPPVHHGLYLDMNCTSDKGGKKVFLGGYNCLGEANNAMKTSARAYLKEHSGVRLFERGLELVGDDGHVRQRYMIKDGRWEDGRFVGEQEWVRREMERRESLSLRNEGTEICRAEGKFCVVPLDTPEAAPAIIKDEVPDVRGTPQPEVQSPPDESQTPNPQPVVEVPTQAAELFCTCRRPDDGSLMLFCDNQNCAIGWYHGRCVDVEKEPADDVEWFCPACLPGIARRVAKKKGAKGGKRAQGKKRGAEEVEGGVEKQGGGRKKKRTG